MSYKLRLNLSLPADRQTEIKSWSGQTVEHIVYRLDKIPIPFFGGDVHTWSGSTDDFYFIISVAANKIFMNAKERQMQLILDEKDSESIGAILGNEEIDPEILIYDLLKFVGWKLKENCRIDVNDF